MAATTETDARLWEYETFAPAGETCPSCLKPVKSLDRCRRGAIPRASGSDVVVYRHIDCQDPTGEKRRKARR